eukprot:3400292-Prymnesium_polylepis.1
MRRASLSAARSSDCCATLAGAVRRAVRPSELVAVPQTVATARLSISSSDERCSTKQAPPSLRT